MHCTVNEGSFDFCVLGLFNFWHWSQSSQVQLACCIENMHSNVFRGLVQGCAQFAEEVTRRNVSIRIPGSFQEISSPAFFTASGKLLVHIALTGPCESCYEKSLQALVWDWRLLSKAFLAIFWCSVTPSHLEVNLSVLGVQCCNIF